MAREKEKTDANTRPLHNLTFKCIDSSQISREITIAKRGTEYMSLPVVALEERM